MEYSIQSIIDGVVENEPSKVQAAFDYLIGPKIMDSLDTRKKELANSIFNRENNTDVDTNETEVINDENTESTAEEN